MRGDSNVSDCSSPLSIGSEDAIPCDSSSAPLCSGTSSVGCMLVRTTVEVGTGEQRSNQRMATLIGDGEGQYDAALRNSLSLAGSYL